MTQPHSFGPPLFEGLMLVYGYIGKAMPYNLSEWHHLQLTLALLCLWYGVLPSGPVWNLDRDMAAHLSRHGMMGSDSDTCLPTLCCRCSFSTRAWSRTCRQATSASPLA